MQSDTYEIVIKFSRSHSDDCNVIGNSEPENLVKQLVKELQAAYDHKDIGIAGSFEVISGPKFFQVV